MLPYYIAYGSMLIAAAIGCFRGQKKNRVTERGYCVFFACLWILLLGLRHPSMGVDLAYGSPYGYLGRFLYIDALPLKTLLQHGVNNYEPGYIVFCKLLGFFTDDYQVLLFVCAALCIGLIAAWIYRNSEYPFFSTVIYLGVPCFLMNYSGLRQALAIAISVWAFEMIKKKNVVGFLSVVMLASLFHKSALTYLIAYPVYHIKMRKNSGLLAMLSIPIVYVFREPLFLILSKLFKDDAQMDYNGAVTLLLVFSLVYLFSALVGHEDDQAEVGPRNLLLVACLCQTFGGVYQTAMRVGYYFMIYLVILLPRLVANTYARAHSFNNRRIALLMYIGILVCFGAFGLYSIKGGSWARSAPYSFFWQ